MKKFIFTVFCMQFSLLHSFAQSSGIENQTNAGQAYELAYYQIDENSNELINPCEWCSPPSNCIKVTTWRGRAGGECDFYSKVNNLTNRTITYQVCVLLASGRWDCGVSGLGAGKEGGTIYYCNVGSRFEYKYWAAYGDYVLQECKFPDPNNK